MKAWFIRRLKEPSTWAGIVSVATAIGGFTISEEQRQAVIAAGSALVGLLLLFVKEDQPPVAPRVDTPPAVEPGPGPILHTTPKPGEFYRANDGTLRRFPVGTGHLTDGNVPTGSDSQALNTDDKS